MIVNALCSLCQNSYGGIRVDEGVRKECSADKKGLPKVYNKCTGGKFAECILFVQISHWFVVGFEMDGFAEFECDVETGEHSVKQGSRGHGCRASRAQ